MGEFLVEGKIIKFYREKAQMTQKELVQGICSITHLSKIERGITEYSKEMITLLSERLQINIKEEVRKYHLLGQKLDEWQNALISQQTEDSARLKKEIEDEPLKELPDFHASYNLILSRYHLFMNLPEKAFEGIQIIQGKESQLSSYERNYLKHIMGIYYFLTGQYKDCINILTSIDHSGYHHNEYYYHLALAHHSTHSNIASYYYAEKALAYFHKTLNVLRIIDTETMMLVQLNARELHDFEETKKKYDSLIKMCDACQAYDRKSKLLNNLAFECYRRKRFADARKLYERALLLVDEDNPFYTMFLDGYINNAIKGKLLNDTEITDLAEKGLRLARKHNGMPPFYFQLHLYAIQEEEEKFYRLIEEEALPFFRKTGYIVLIDHYEKKLFHYLVKINETTKALQLAQIIIESHKSHYDGMN
ncbi:helix-turn-helix domain-containing protein [Peribacillus sp. NPDC101481]|uniref:response regulator aspartate phosphatase n=1 Tax=unclassified Peribacillus TaxID=2675266 RepID=UPI003826D23E